MRIQRADAEPAAASPPSASASAPAPGAIPGQGLSPPAHSQGGAGAGACEGAGLPGAGEGAGEGGAGPGHCYLLQPFSFTAHALVRHQPFSKHQCTPKLSAHCQVRGSLTAL